jgi:DNA mismatch repair ATPase MutL
MALKTASKTVQKIRKMLQSYALARPTIRFSLKVVKAKSDAPNWVYAPTLKSTIADAALKAAGQDVGSQCITRSWPGDDSDDGNSTKLRTTSADDESEQGLKLTALLPSPNAGMCYPQRIQK